jgi:hypothetical protein
MNEVEFIVPYMIVFEHCTSLTDRNGKTRRFSFDARDRYFPKLTDFPITSDRSCRILGSDRRSIYSGISPKRSRYLFSNASACSLASFS